MSVEAVGPFGDGNCHHVGQAQQLLGATRMLPGYSEALAKALEVATRCLEFRGKDGRMDSARVPDALKSEMLTARREVMDTLSYYASDPKGISIREALVEKHASLWPGRMAPLCELSGAEETDTRAWFRDLGALEAACQQDGWTIYIEDEFYALKERRRRLIRAYAGWWGAADDAAAAAAHLTLHRNEPVLMVSLE